jgi:hypothetical protein
MIKPNGVSIMTNPILDYEYAKARHQEIEAKLNQRHRAWPTEVDPQRAPTKRRLIFGFGTIVLGIFTIAQALAG